MMPVTPAIKRISFGLDRMHRAVASCVPAVKSARTRTASGSSLVFILAVLFSGSLVATQAIERPDGASSPEQLYNNGTQRLREGKLRDAENSLESAVASQNAKVQAPSLYNLGHVRFRQGQEILKMASEGKKTEEQARRAEALGIDAVQTANQALSGSDLAALVAAYQEGRGAHKELKAATEAVNRALEISGSTLVKWQRASGDFKSAYELQPSDTDAESNAQVVDASIAQLVDQQRLTQQQKNGIEKQRQELRQKMKELKGRMPKQLSQQLGEPEDDDEDEQPPKEPQPGQEEAAHKPEKERLLSPEEAARLLDMLRLDANRKLFQAGTNSPSTNKNRRNW